MTTQTHTYRVTGMTCEHCVRAVTAEITAIPGVTDVAVQLGADGPSEVTVRTTGELADSQVAEALDEAGDYRLAPA